MGSLLVVTGPPGAGKSTVSAVLADRLSPSALVQGDQFMAAVRTGFIPPWLAESNDQNQTVAAAMAASTAAYVEGGFHTVLDGVLGPWALEAFMSAAEMKTLDYLVLLPPIDIVAERVTNRVHELTDPEPARKMHHEFVKHLPDERHVVRSVGAVAALVAEIEARRGDGEFAFPG